MQISTNNSTYFEEYASSEITHSSRIICTPSQFAKSSMMYVQEIGRLRSLKSHISKRQNLDSFLFILILSGKGTLSYKGKKYELEKSSYAFIDCKEPYSHQSSDNDPWELFWVHFNGYPLESYYDYYMKRIGFPVSKTENPAYYIETLEKIFSNSNGKSTDNELISSSLLNNLVTTIISSKVTNSLTPDKDNNKMFQIMEFINQNYKTKINLDMLSTNFYISKYHLSREFKKNYGVTITYYIINKRITYAKGLLRFTNLQISEIARTCGIEDNSYFNKQFIKIEGMTATEYRKQWR
ncbi:MAG: AraC family transcriptional regulator [Candidatus Paracaedibacteraceae bacterium]|nr:AraC family transcriptional regulator [Candidatus Paracaedibacteraceae bacterium]